MSSKTMKTKKGASPLHHLLCCVMPAAAPNLSPTEAPSDPGVDKVLNSLEQLGSRAGGDRLDLDFLKDLLMSNDFQSLLKVHEKVTTPETPEQEPVIGEVKDLAKDVTDELRDVYTPEAQELMCILLQPHFKAMLDAHDIIALKEFQPELPAVHQEVDEDEDSAIKLIRLVKGPSEPLGATINLNEETGQVKIARVMHGGAADRSGLIHVGDEVQEVNGVTVSGMPPEHVIKLLSNAVGPITLKLVPAAAYDDSLQESKMRVRAHFSYNPANDQAIPCKEAGLGFTKGDILHIVSMTDPLWWQARREENPRARAALIPSRDLQEKRNAAMKATSSQNNNKDNKENKNQRSRFSPRLTKKSKKNKKVIQQEEESEDSSAIYEELGLHYPKEGQYRPVVLVGPPGVGRTVLKRRLKETNPDHFQTPIPHTSRPRKSSEVDGQDFHFISKSIMEKDIENKKFIEYGEFKGHLYGTSVEQVKSVISEGQVCLLCPQPQALKALRTPEIKPFIVLVKPPSFDPFKSTRMSANIQTDENQPKQFTDEEIHELIAAANHMESYYAHYLDHVIVNEDLQRTVNELGQVLYKLETEAHWVPVDWLR